jgi:hypothetical protein
MWGYLSDSVHKLINVGPDPQRLKVAASHGFAASDLKIEL